MVQKFSAPHHLVVANLNRYHANCALVSVHDELAPMRGFVDIPVHLMGAAIFQKDPLSPVEGMAVSAVA